MSRSPCEPSRLDRRRIRAEAAVWLARLHGPSRTTALEEGLKRWLAEDPLHALEFELATDVWEESAHHPDAAPLGGPHVVRHATLPRFVVPLLSSLAATLLIGVSLFFLLRDPASFSTAVGEQKTIILADGSRITLNTNTQISVRYRDHVRVVTLKHGEAYFDIVHNPNRLFIVRAGTRKILDLGTRFVVSRVGNLPNSLAVTVIEGQVAVAPIDTSKLAHLQPAPQVRIVSAGQLLGFHADALPTIRTVSVAEATAWLNGQLIFDGTPLREAAAQFNRYNALKIRIASSEIAEIRVGGVFRIGDSASFAKAVAESHHLLVVARQDTLTLEPTVPLH